MARANRFSVLAALLLAVLVGCGQAIEDLSKTSPKSDRAIQPRRPGPTSRPSVPGRWPFIGDGNNSAPVPKTTCGEEEGWQYCIHRYAGNKPGILYYVHSFTDSEHGWAKGYEGERPSQLTRLQELLGEDSPTVVVISYVDRAQDSWLLSVGDRKTQPPEIATVKHFTTKAMPLVEKRFDLKGPRTVYGFSMGGFNATQLCLNAPQLWSKCVLQNAVLVRCDPYSLPEWTRFLCLPGYLIRKQFTPEEWKENDPFVKISSVNASALPPILVTNARGDQFNLFEAGRIFADELKEKGARVLWHPIEGEHGDFDADAIFDFLLEN